MILTFDWIRPGLDTTSFADITPTVCLRVEYKEEVYKWEVEFEADLTTREWWYVHNRCMTPDTTSETMLNGLVDSYVELRQIRNSGAGTQLSGIQLSNAVRAQSTAIIRIIRMMVGDVSGPAE